MNRSNFFLIYTLTSLLLCAVVTTPLYAQVNPNPFNNSANTINIGTQVGNSRLGVNVNTSPGTLVSNIVLILFIVGGLAVLVFFIWGALDWITAGGDKEKIAGARRKIINSFIGLTLLALSYFIISFFGQIIGFNPLTPPPVPRLDQ